MRTPTGETFEFSERPWTKIASFLGGMAAEHSEFQYLTDVIESIAASGRDKQLAGSTSMHDLVVVPQPVGSQVYELLIVRAPSSMRPGPRGLVRIEHLSSTGHNECVDRPVSEAVPLFWRFVIEKFGMDPPCPAGLTTRFKFDQPPSGAVRHGPHRARHLVVVSLGTCAERGELQLPVQLRPRADYFSPTGVGQLVRSRWSRPGSALVPSAWRE